MMPELMRVLSVLLISPMAISHPPEFSLKSLTAGPDRLPRGCRLAQVPRSAGKRLVVAYPNLTDNPWIGTDRDKVRAIREVVDGPPYSEGREEWSRLSDDVVDSYRAVYVAADKIAINVYAVQFKNPSLAARAMRPRPGNDHRVLVGRSVVVRVLAARRGECFRAIAEYIGAFKDIDYPVR